MKGRSTLVLLVLVLLTGGIIFFQEWYRLRNPSREIRRVRLFDIDPTTLTAITFTHSNSVVRCVKENGVWMVGEPSTGMGRADLALFYAMVSGINEMGKGTTITEQQLEMRGLDPKEYGFDPAVIHIDIVDGLGHRGWKIGREKPLGSEVYVMVDGEDSIHTAPGKLLGFIPQASDQLRDRILFPINAAGVRRLEMRGPSGFIRIDKDPVSGWRIMQPVAAQADPLEMERFIEKLCSARIDSFVADNVPDWSIYGLQEETKQISVGGADGTARMLVLGDPIADRPGVVYARRADDTSVFAVQSDILELLQAPVDRFRDARVVTIPKNDVDYIRIKRDPDTLTLMRDEDGRWQVTTPMVWEADPDAVQNLINLWSAAVITEYNEATSAQAAEWILDFGASQSGTSNHIELLPAGGNREGLFIRKDADKSLFRINFPEVPPSIINPLGYKNPRVWTLNKSEVNRLGLKTADGTTRIVQMMDDGTYAFVGLNGKRSVNAEAMDRLLELLSGMKTTGYITYNPSSLDIYGLASPRYEIQVGLAGTNQLGRVLLVGNETPKGFYSMVKGRDVIFYLDKATVNTISSNLGPDENTPAPQN